VWRETSETTHRARNRSERFTELSKPRPRIPHTQCSSIGSDTDKSIELHGCQHSLIARDGGRGGPRAVGRSEIEEVVDGW
jgi:hypothetical protein